MPTSQEIIINTESAEYVVVRLNKARLNDLAKLHSEVYGTPVNENYFLKKYDTAYTGLEHVGYLAYNTEGTPVAHYGVIPCFIQYKTDIMLAAQSADTMTHPKYRYKGMFVDLSNKTFDLCRELGIRLIFGFPNQNSYHGAVNKLGWKITESMACFIIRVKGLPLESICRKAKWLERLYESYRQLIFKRISLPLNGIANSATTDGFAGVYRDEEYFAYKTYNFSRIIRIGDAKVWISNRPGMLIGDMEGVDRQNFASVIAKLKALAKKLGIRHIQFHCSPGTSLFKLFSENFEQTPSYPVLFQDFGSPIGPENIKFTFSDIDIF